MLCAPTKVTSLDHLTITSSYTNLDQNSASESRLTSKSKLSPSRHLCIELFFFMNQQENKLRLSAITFLETLTQLWSCVNGNCAKEIWKSRKCKRSHDICPVCSSDQRRRSSNYHLEKDQSRFHSISQNAQH